MFLNEFDVLEGRLEYLYDHVDYFVIVESNITQSGDDKPFHFLSNMFRYKKYLDKVLYFPFITNKEKYNYAKKPVHDRDFDTGTWQLENSQRNHIGEALKMFKDDDIVMISDIDEIPHTECIKIAKENFNPGWPAFAIQQRYYAYNFNQHMKKWWHGTVITTNSYAKQYTPQGIRNMKYEITFIPNGGWHLTYWGDVKTIQYKIQTFAHQELNQDKFKDPEHIKNQILKGQDMFMRGENEFEPADRTQIDPEILRIFGPYEQKLIDSLNNVSN